MLEKKIDFIWLNILDMIEKKHHARTISNLTLQDAIYFLDMYFKSTITDELLKEFDEYEMLQVKFSHEKESYNLKITRHPHGGIYIEVSTIEQLKKAIESMFTGTPIYADPKKHITISFV